MNDICQNRHRGNSRSNAVNPSEDSKINDRTFIVNYLKKNGTTYSKEIARLMGKQLNQVSGRFSELKKDNIIEATDEVKEGCSVYKLMEKELTLF